MNFTIRQLKEKIQYLFKFLKKKIGFDEILPLNHDFKDVASLGHFKTYLVKSNKWGVFKIPNKYLNDFKTWISLKGWVFETPSRNYGVIGYPSITFHSEPIQISKIEQYDINYSSNLTIEKHRKFNTSFDFWVGSRAKFEFPTVTHEIMIWDNYFVAMPFGKYKGTVSISGSTYRVYSGYIDKSKENLGIHGWTYIAFLAIDRVQSNSINMKEALDYLISEGMLSEDLYLNRSEFGNEVYNASGMLTLNSFESRLNKMKVNI